MTWKGRHVCSLCNIDFPCDKIRYYYDYKAEFFIYACNSCVVGLLKKASDASQINR